MSTSLYEHDFYAWANEQAALLRSGNLSAADIEHIAEEIESMGKTEKRELVSRLTVLLAHLLKWEYQSRKRSNSWRLSVEEQRKMLEDHLIDNPSLKARLPEAMQSGYTLARLSAAKETKLNKDTFPKTCPWSFEQVIDDGFWPGEVKRH